MGDIIEYKPFGSEVSIKLTPAIVKKYLVAGNGMVSDQEVVMFLMLCRNARLDPFRKEAYLIKFGQSPATIVTGKDTFTKRAEAHPDHNGMQAGVIVKREEQIIEQIGSFIAPGDEILGGWAKVWKKSRDIPYYHTVSFDEYVGLKGNGEVNAQWKAKPATMIRKVALVQVLREAYPDILGGMYSEEEMQSTHTYDVSERDVSPPTSEEAAEEIDGGEENQEGEEAPAVEEAEVVDDEQQLDLPIF